LKDLRLLLGQRHSEDAYIEVYGGYATRLMRLQLELIQALDKHRRGRRGNKQTVEVRHVHIHSILVAREWSASSIR
jgi:hypothetical protein